MYIIKFLHGYIFKILHYAKEHLVLKVLTTSTCNSFLKWPYHLVIASITYWWMCNCFPILFFLWRCSYVTRPRPIYLIFFLQSCHGFCYIFDISFLFYNFSFSCPFLLILSYKSILVQKLYIFKSSITVNNLF